MHKRRENWQSNGDQFSHETTRISSLLICSLLSIPTPSMRSLDLSVFCPFFSSFSSPFLIFSRRPTTNTQTLCANHPANQTTSVSQGFPLKRRETAQNHDLLVVVYAKFFHTVERAPTIVNANICNASSATNSAESAKKNWGKKTRPEI